MTYDFLRSRFPLYSTTGFRTFFEASGRSAENTMGYVRRSHNFRKCSKIAENNRHQYILDGNGRKKLRKTTENAKKKMNFRSNSMQLDWVGWMLMNIDEFVVFLFSVRSLHVDSCRFIYVLHNWYYLSIYLYMCMHWYACVLCIHFQKLIHTLTYTHIRKIAKPWQNYNYFNYLQSFAICDNLTSLYLLYSVYQCVY